MARKTKTEQQMERVLIALWRGEQHTKRDEVIAPLCRANLIDPVEYHPGGSCKRVELTEAGKIIAKKLSDEERQQSGT